MTNNSSREALSTVVKMTGADGQSQSEKTLTVADLVRFAETFTDLASPAVMSPLGTGQSSNGAPLSTICRASIGCCRA